MTDAVFSSQNSLIGTRSSPDGADTLTACYLHVVLLAFDPILIEIMIIFTLFELFKPCLKGLFGPKAEKLQSFLKNVHQTCRYI